MTPNQKQTTELERKEMQDEHELLRRELEANRRFVFERPLVIVGAGLAGYAGFTGSANLHLIPRLVRKNHFLHPARPRPSTVETLGRLGNRAPRVSHMDC